MASARNEIDRAYFFCNSTVDKFWHGQWLTEVCQGSTNLSFQRSVFGAQEIRRSAKCVFLCFLEMVLQNCFFQIDISTIIAMKT